MIELKVNKKLESIAYKMTKEEYEALKESIVDNGQLVPIVIMADGVIVDGHHRLRACNELGLKPIWVVDESIKTLDEAKEYIIWTNLTRRNLTVFQKAELAYNLIHPMVKNQLQNDKSTTSVKIFTHSAGRLDKRIGERVGVSYYTFYKVRRIVDAYEEGKISDEIMNQLRHGERSIDNGYLLVKNSEHIIKVIKDYTLDNPDERVKLMDFIKPKVYTDNLNGAELEAYADKLFHNRRLVKKKIPFDKFKNEDEAREYAARHGGRLIGVEKVWVLEIEKYEFKEDDEE